MSDASGDRPVRKQQQRSLVTQQRLLDAAIAAFSENGFKGTSTRDIADRAGVHHPLITYHFKNKDLLWRAAADRVFSDFADALTQAMANGDSGDAGAEMATLVRAYVRYSHRQPALHRMMLQEASYPNPRLDWLVETHLKPFSEKMVARVSELQRHGIAPDGNPAILFNMLRASAGGLLALSLEVKASSGVDLDSDETIDEFTDMLTRVFLPGRRSA